MKDASYLLSYYKCGKIYYMEIVSQIESKIKAKIKDAKIEVKDIVGDNDHFKLIVSSQLFSGLPILKQHQMVFIALGMILDWTLLFTLFHLRQ